MANLGRLAIAMLGVLAYQNRDKIGDMIRGAGDRTTNDPQGGILDQISKGVSGTALGDILDRFRGAGAESKVDSWVGTGPNQPIQPSDVEAAIDEDTLTSLSMQTGLSREELISRITRDLPEAVNKMTPNGQLPPDETTLLDDVPTRRPQAKNSTGQGNV
ncbi:YidB family protein [Mesorhizobium caraganae]|uniref:YidB family protein n=1 Tax=Mesorhizobium caraganae TaxID=483206 RepID=UPI0019395AB8|nr:YidB family protein [Mesorhizobium caraganae]MBM2712709.1 YidB family protein [Mesorhizobium caraganae]